MPVGIMPTSCASWEFRCVCPASKGGFGLMEAIEFEDEEGCIAIVIGFAFECLDLIVDSFEFAG
jgi:hypothetical protein